MLTESLQKVTDLLNNHSIPYMVIGGYATLFHGHARFTEDIDIVLGIDINEFDRIFEAIEPEFLPRSENPKQFAQQTNVLPVLDKKNEIRVDLIFSFLEFERNAINRALTTFVDEFEVKIIQVEDLIVYKMLAGRARDLEDVKVIINKNKTEIDIKKTEERLMELSNLLGNDEIMKNWKDIIQI